jgi:hypothetical protein
MKLLHESQYAQVAVNDSDEVFVTHKQGGVKIRISSNYAGNVSITYETKDAELVPTNVNGIPGLVFHPKRKS